MLILFLHRCINLLMASFSHPVGGASWLVRLEMCMLCVLCILFHAYICTLCPPKSPYRATPVHPAGAQHLQEGSSDGA